MSHSVSETAARAVKNSQRVQAETRTPEQRLISIQKNLEAKLFVPPDEQRFLLELYLNAQASIITSGSVLFQYAETIEEQKAQIADLQTKVEEFRKVYEEENRSMALKVERIVDGVADGN